MTTAGLLEIGLYLAAVTALVKPLGSYMARVYQGQPTPLSRLLFPIENGLYRLCGIRAGEEMTWYAYTAALLAFNLAGALALYAIQRLQGIFPLNPQGLPAVEAATAFNVAASFTSNTNWQSYAGETTMSYLTQMVGLTAQNFLSAATGMAILVALARGLSRRAAPGIGNFWADLTRGTLYILLPLSLILAVFLVSQGVVQTLGGPISVPLLQPVVGEAGRVIDTQVMAAGPAASQVAIKQLGTNGGGFFGANSAHPFENPTPLSNAAEALAILALPAALCYTFGRLVGDTRQGWALLAAMSIIFIVCVGVIAVAEQQGNPVLQSLGVNQDAGMAQAGGNMEGKEVRFGVTSSALWAAATTAASNGSVNAMHDSLMPLGGLAAMWLMQLGEVVYGGVGTGLAGMVVLAIIAVFVAGLMVGRTPEYLGKKITAYEMKMASLVILIPPMVVLLGTALAVMTGDGRAGALNPGAHGFSEILYAFSSAANNNGSAFGGLNAATPFYNVTLALAMLIGRYWLAIPTLALAGSLAAKQPVAAGPGTLPTHTPLFVALLIGVVLLVGALTFFPALALGPIAEQLAAAW